MEKNIDLVLDETYFKSGITKYVKWEYHKLPHMVIFGSTGSGKTYMLKILLGRIGKRIPDSEIILCDYKSDDDFAFADGSGNFYRFDSCMEGLNRAVEYLRTRQEHLTEDRHFVALVFDEWASFLSNLDKKSAEQAKQSLALLLMLGRSFNIHVIVSQQRLDAVYFGNARDNFSVVAGLGVLSKESVQMMFSEYKDIIDADKQQGHGSILLGSQFREILVPTVGNRQALHDWILTALRRFGQDESH